MFDFKKSVSRIVILVMIFSMLAVSNVQTVSAGNVDLNNPIFNFNKILFVKHQPYPGSYGEQHMIDQYFGFNGVPGGGLYILNNAFTGTKSVTDVLANSICANGRYQGKKLFGRLICPLARIDVEMQVFGVLVFAEVGQDSGGSPCGDYILRYLSDDLK